MSVVYQIPDETHAVYCGGRSGISIQPDLSNRHDLHTIHLNGNKLEEVRAELFPPSLFHLNLSSNDILDGLPATWPDTIQTLNLDYNYIPHTKFIEHWPSSLRELSMDGNANRSCPTNLPTSLEMLSMAGCKLQSIDTLPYTLKKLRANYNYIKTIKLLPRHLLYLQLSQNAIRSSILFKYRLPPMIRVLHLDYNELTWLPSTFPDSLETLNVSNNTITEFRAKLPASLKLLQLNDNKLTVFQPTFSVPQQSFVLYIQNNCITENLDYLLEKRYVSTLFRGKNWNTALHTASARMIQFAFAKYKLKRGIRTWARMNTIQKELFMVAMHPDRLGQFEPLPNWSN